MSTTVIAAEPVIRLACFLGMLLAVAGWEVVAPRRASTIRRFWRWSNNLALVAVDTVIVRAVFPLTGSGVALLAQSKGWGLFNLVAVPDWIAVPATVVLLDLTIFGQHVVFHVVPVLWRLHRMHHADLDFDVTTGLRFHPGEILLSFAIKLTAVILLGAPPIAVLGFEVLLNATSLFNHGNVRLPPGWDRFVRLLVVTPDMHRVHHSIDFSETNSNFGFNVPWWDRLFATYRARPALGHDRMVVGINAFRDPHELRIDRMLWQPMRNDPAATMPPHAPASCG